MREETKKKETEESQKFGTSETCFTSLWSSAQELGLSSKQLAELAKIAASSEKITGTRILSILRMKNEN